MADMCNFFHRQRVTESELDLAFDLLEQADRDFTSDIGVYGIISGAEPTPHQPVPDLTIDLTAPCRAYDHLGQRVFFGSKQRVNCSIDHLGAPTEVTQDGNERWLGVFIKFDRLLSDPRTDGHSQQVYFRRDESFKIIVRQNDEALAGTAEKVDYVEDELLICQVRVAAGQTQITYDDIDIARRQNFIFAEASAIEIITGGWNVISPGRETVQEAFDSIDELLDNHFDGSDYRHAAGNIDYAPDGFVQSTDVQSALDEIIIGISSQVPGSTGAALVGAEPVTGLPHILSAGRVQGQLAQLLEFINNHVSDILDAHAASAIGATPHLGITGSNVQQQLEQLVTGMIDTLAVHNASEDHDGLYFPRAEADTRFYNVGEKVGDADTLDSKHATDFAEAEHQHDGRYLRTIGEYEWSLEANETESFNLAAFPHVVDVKYRRVFPGGSLGDYVVAGEHTWAIEVVIKEITAPQGYTYFEAEIRNSSSQHLRVYFNVYTIA